MISKLCLYCKNKFATYPCFADTKLYCSRTCRVADQSRRQTGRAYKGKVHLTCQFCGKEFEVFPSDADRGRKFCSKSCLVNGQERPERRKPWLWRKVKCPTCKKYFETRHESQNHCSKKCADSGAARRAKIGGKNHYTYGMTADAFSKWLKCRVTTRVDFRGRKGIITAHSQWEVHVYQLLQNLGIPFKYANEDDVTFDLTDCVWHPDFVLIRRRIILEVKGRWRDSFNQKIKKFIKKFGHDYSVYLIDFDTSKKTYKTLQQLIGDATMVHKRTI